MTDVRPLRLPGSGPDFVPVADVMELELQLVIRIALPGVLEEDIDLSFDSGGLTVRGELEQPVVVDEGRPLVQEWHYGFFERRFDIPDDVDREAMLVVVECGVLELKLPRRR